MIEVAAAVIISKGRILLASRPADKPPAGWEFPGGKLEAGESVFDAAKRELMEELHLPVIPEKVLFVKETDTLTLHFVRCSISEDASPLAQENQEFRWVNFSGPPPADLLENDRIFWNLFCSKERNSITSMKNLHDS